MLLDSHETEDRKFNDAFPLHCFINDRHLKKTVILFWGFKTTGLWMISFTDRQDITLAWLL